jgi:hypothetical protein
MDFSTAKNEVAERLQDTTAAHLTRCGEWLNLAMQEMVAYAEWEWLQAGPTNLAITAALQSYAFTTIAADVDWIYDIRIETDGGWKLMPYSQSEFDTLMPDPDLESGRPEGYAIWGRTILLDRSPDASYTAKVRYYKTVSNLSVGSDTPPWKSEWDHIWLIGAQFYGYEFNDDSRADKARLRFEGWLKTMFAKNGAYSPNVVSRGFAGGAYPPGSPWPRHRFGAR